MPFIELQKYIYEKLQALNIPVLDHIPQNDLTFPYIFIGDDVFMDSPTKDLQHFSCYCNIHVFSNAQGNKELKEILTNITNLITIGNLDNNWVITHKKVANTHILGDSRPNVIHGLIQYYFEIAKIKE